MDLFTVSLVKSSGRLNISHPNVATTKKKIATERTTKEYCTSFFLTCDPVLQAQNKLFFGFVFFLLRKRPPFSDMSATLGTQTEIGGHRLTVYCSLFRNSTQNCPLTGGQRIVTSVLQWNVKAEWEEHEKKMVMEKMWPLWWELHKTHCIIAEKKNVATGSAKGCRFG